MKHLIKKILREASEVDPSIYDGGNNLTDLESRVRVIMKSVQKIPNLGKFIEDVKTQGMDRGYYSNNSWIKHVTQDISSLPRFIGGEIRHSNTGDFVWLVVKTFLNNGGYQRDFSNTDDPLDLSPIIVYEVDAQYKQPLVEYGVIWGVPYGADSKDEAQTMMMDDPFTWEEDRDMNDHDDYGDTEVYDVERVETRELKFTKEFVGL